jgi:glutamate racemase
MKMSHNPIGIFDSGVGGLSVWKEIDCWLPNESIVYYADNQNCPYGEKTPGEIIRYSEKAVQFLLNKGCKLIVVACNTATSQAIDYLRSTFPVPFIGTMPAVKPASINSKTGTIAVLATSSTLKSKKFNEARQEFSATTEIILVEGDELVDIVENGLQGTEQSEKILHKCLDPLIEKNIDHIVLGCTHFPFLIEDIRKITGDNVILDNSAEAIAKRTRFIIEQEGLEVTFPHMKVLNFISTGDSRILRRMIENITGSRENYTPVPLIRSI